MVENSAGISFAAWKQSQQKISSSKSTLGNTKIITGPNTSLSNTTPLDALNLTSSLYGSQKQAANIYLIYYSYQDVAWAQTEFDKLNDSSPSGYNAATNNCRTDTTCWGASAWLNSKQEGILLIAVGVKDSNHTSGSLESHEYAHTIQMIQAPLNTALVPRWFLEGGAIWTQCAAIFSTDFSKYLDERKRNAGDLFASPSLYTAKWITEFLNPNPLTTWAYWNNYENWRIYDIGMLATEALVALKGPEAYMRLYTNVGNGLTFASSFEKEFGISWTEAAPIIAEAIEAQIKTPSYPAPTPAANMTVAQKWSATGSRAMEGYEKAFPSQLAQFPELETIWRISDAVNPIIATEIQKQYKESVQFWSAYTKHPGTLQVIVGNLDDVEFVCKWRNTYLEMQQPNCVTEFRQDKSRTWDAHTTQTAGKATDFYFMTDPKTLQDDSFWPRVPHEFFHNVQFAQTPRYKFVLPCWAEEGGAEYFGILIASQGTPDKFLSMRVKLMMDRNGKIKQSQLAQSDWKSWLLATDMSSLADGQSGWGCESASREGIYSYGFMATEYLNLKLGTSGLLALYQDAGLLGWDKAIEKAFNKSKADAYDEIASYMKREYEIGVNQKVLS